jgi:hypothetical protein
MPDLICDDKGQVIDVARKGCIGVEDCVKYFYRSASEDRVKRCTSPSPLPPLLTSPIFHSCLSLSSLLAILDIGPHISPILSHSLTNTACVREKYRYYEIIQEDHSIKTIQNDIQDVLIKI